MPLSILHIATIAVVACTAVGADPELVDRAKLAGGRSTDGVGRPFDPTAHDCKLWGWGSNKFGELLQQPIGGKNVNSPIRITQQQLGPLQVDDIRSIQSGTAACRGHDSELQVVHWNALLGRKTQSLSRCISVSGAAYAWGLNLNGFLGVSGAQLTVPTLLPIPKGPGSKVLVAQAACVGMHLLMNVKSCYIYALTDDGKLYTTVASVGKRLWVEASAFNFEGPLVTISTGSYFVVAANTAGTVFQFNADFGYYYGAGDKSVTPPRVSRITGDIVGLGAGEAFGIARTSTGSVWTWGAGNNGQLCHSSGSLTGLNAGKVPGDTWQNACSSEDYGIYLSNAGDAFICGERNRGQDGNVIATKGRNPGRVLAGKGIIRLACGESHVVVATSDGRAFAWGANDFGQAGGNNKAARFKAMYNVGQRPLELAFPGAVSADKVVDVGAGFVHSYAITCQFN